MVSENVRKLREDLNLSREKFGEKLFVSADVINNIERGRVNPNPRLLDGICKTFCVREEWLRTGEGEMYEQNAHTILDQLAEEYRLGPAGRMIVDAALKMYDIGGERAFVEMIRDLLPVMQDIVAQAEGRAFIDAAPQDSTAERSASV